MIRVYDETGNVIETHEQTGRFERGGEFAKQSERFREDLAPKEDLPSCSVIMQTVSMRQEIDCRMQSNYS